MNQEKIGKFITLCRKEKGLTQEKIAEKLGVTSKSISRWENGKTMPDYSILKDLCNELNININEFFSAEKIKEENYMMKAEENFIYLKKKVDRVIKLLDIIGWVVAISMIVLFFVHMYFNWLYHGPWDDSGFKSVTNILLWIMISSAILVGMLKYDIKNKK